MAKQMSKKTLGLIAAVVLLVLIAPVLVDGENIEVDGIARQGARTKFVRLSLGETEYLDEGQGGAGTVVLVHGVSGPMSSWDRTVPALVDRGFRVVRYNTYGRGLSDRPFVDYELKTYVDQLADLIDELSLPPKISVVGHSFGSIVASSYATQFDNRIANLVLMSPAGFPIEANPVARLLDVPLLGKYLFHLLGDWLLVSHNENYYVEEYPEAIEAYRDQMKYVGFKRVQLSTMRHAPVQNFLDGFAAVGRKMFPKALIWGLQDETFPISYAVDAKSLLPKAEYFEIEGAAHMPHYERPEIVNPILGRLLTSKKR